MYTEKIQRIIKEKTILAYLVLFVIGIGFIVIAICCFSKEPSIITTIEGKQLVQNASNSNWYNVFMGLGCSIMATPIITLYISSILPKEIDNLSEWGLENIYNARSEIKIAKNNLPSSDFEIMALGLKHLRDTIPKNELKKKIRKGLKVRIITLNPMSIYVQEQEAREQSNGLSKDIQELIAWVHELSEDNSKNNGKGCIEIRTYDSIPFDFYMRVDNKIYVGPYEANKSSSEQIAYQFKYDSKGGNKYSNYFNSIWNNENLGVVLETIKIAKPAVIDVDKAIVGILKYFSSLLSESSIGVVAIFKDNLRRTFYSCNKPEIEKYKTHVLQKGALGVLVNFYNKEKNGTKIILCDYVNNISLLYKINGRNKTLEKLNVHLEHLDSKEDTKAIIVAPLRINGDFSGAVTYDFSDMPICYRDNIEAFRACKFETLSEELMKKVEYIFDCPLKSAELIQNLLGEGVKSSYKQRYNEKWNPVEEEEQ